MSSAVKLLIMGILSTSVLAGASEPKTSKSKAFSTYCTSLLDRANVASLRLGNAYYLRVVKLGYPLNRVMVGRAEADFILKDGLSRYMNIRWLHTGRPIGITIEFRGQFNPIDYKAYIVTDGEEKIQRHGAEFWEHKGTEVAREITSPEGAQLDNLALMIYDVNSRKQEVGVGDVVMGKETTTLL